MVNEKHRSPRTLTTIGNFILDWATPQQQLKHLADDAGHNYAGWEDFRDRKCRKWVNLSVTCGLIMSGVATILFSKYPLQPGAFTLAAASIISGLIASGIAIGLIYVLGDLDGLQYKNLMQRHPVLFAFVLVLPQAWAMICFATFYFAFSAALWDAVNKLWLVKAGVAISIFMVVTHLLLFVFAFGLLSNLWQRAPSQDTPIVEKINSTDSDKSANRCSIDHVTNGP